MRKPRTTIVFGDTLACAAVAAWVGGHAALGAFGARIMFRELPRAQAAATMTAIFRSFDELIMVAMALLATVMVVRTVALGGAAFRGAAFAASLAALALLAVGVAEVAFVHPTIERMFQEGATLSPRFAAMHKLSERLAHLGIALSLLLYGAFAWGRRPGGAGPL